MRRKFACACPFHYSFIRSLTLKVFGLCKKNCTYVCTRGPTITFNLLEWSVTSWTNNFPCTLCSLKCGKWLRLHVGAHHRPVFFLCEIGREWFLAHVLIKYSNNNVTLYEKRELSRFGLFLPFYRLIWSSRDYCLPIILAPAGKKL